MNVFHYTVSIVHIIHVQVCKQEDTVLNFSSIHSSLGVKLEVNELPKSTGVVVVDSLRIAKGFHDWANKQTTRSSVSMLQ